MIDRSVEKERHAPRKSCGVSTVASKGETESGTIRKVDAVHSRSDTLRKITSGFSHVSGSSFKLVLLLLLLPVSSTERRLSVSPLPLSPPTTSSFTGSGALRRPLRRRSPLGDDPELVLEHRISTAYRCLTISCGAADHRCLSLSLSLLLFDLLLFFLSASPFLCLLSLLVL